MPRAMEILVWIGGALSVCGLVGLLWCIRKAIWLKGAGLPDEEAKVEINKLAFGHMAAIGTAFLGIGLLVSGLLLS